MKLQRIFSQLNGSPFIKIIAVMAWTISMLYLLIIFYNTQKILIVEQKLNDATESLSRIEANTKPNDTRSLSVIEKHGYKVAAGDIILKPQCTDTLKPTLAIFNNHINTAWVSQESEDGTAWLISTLSIPDSIITKDNPLTGFPDHTYVKVSCFPIIK
jgi:hypothetical protein